ncbi:O-methyltransferase-like protein [Mollisia scopiformis]|uniref:O-methyltransferas-like protein n=1 Tax=Mollisia scopiformis TaxID=149040 RepID=A0A132B453_MOLSC|nr:O-methyltransferase-like protein [Mollisia scopiformis]KUJ07170.1 O-methyltransferas-like protein [Mollisia scopiformis]
MLSNRIIELAAIISTNTEKVNGYLEAQGIPTPSFNVDAPPNLGIPKEAIEVDNARRKALAASIELQDLLQGPSACLRPVMNGTSLDAIYVYDIASKVPLYSNISFSNLAKQCELPELDLRRILRFAMCWHRVFCEPERGYVAHTAASRQLRDDPKAMDMAGLMFDECWQSMARTVDAMRTFSSSEPNESGHALAHNTKDSMFDWLGKNPEKARRFTSAISTLVPAGREAAFLPRAFDWASLGASTVVDVGGSSGGVSILLAQEFKDLNFVVQDLPEAINGAEEKVPAELRPRIKFMEHDFFTEQPIVAETFLLRAVLHNWPDHYCVKILQKLIPALRHGARIIVNDGVVPELGTLDLLGEKNIRAYDMLMMTLFNARERELEDWITLFTQADKRFKFVGVKKMEVGTMSVITVVWEDK